MNTPRRKIAAVSLVVLLGLLLRPEAPGTTPEPDGELGPDGVTGTVFASETRLPPGLPLTPAHGATAADAQQPPDPFPPARPRLTWVPGQVMVRPEKGGDLLALARRLGVRVVEPVGIAGLGALSVPAGMDTEDFADQLKRGGWVAWAGPMGITRGAATTAAVLAEQAYRIYEGGEWSDGGVDDGSGSGSSGTTGQSGGGSSGNTFDQWHLDAIDLPETAPGLSGVVVAVLDSGVAYEDYSDAMGTYQLAYTLDGTVFVNPWDFVNDDAHANDDHQHGTHITSIIASYGLAKGVARGVKIMPVKILDETNSGTEIDLINGIQHAVDHGADIINMSLSFAPNYVLTQALGNTLQAAHEAGVILVAAAGNDGLKQVSYPAAYPPVIGVGASECDPSYTCSDVEAYRVAEYSNSGPGADVYAPGGNLNMDGNGDGMPDGVLAESFMLGQPSSQGWFAMAGTSQATAIVSGAAAHLVAVGADVDHIVTPLRFTAFGGDPELTWRDADQVATPQVLAARDGLSYFQPNRDPVHVAMLPYIKSIAADRGAPHFRLQALEADGSPMVEATLYGTLLGADDGMVSCTTDAEGVCTVTGTTQTLSEHAGWALTIAATVDRSWNVRDTYLAMFATDGLEAMIEAMGEEKILGFHWDEGADSELGNLAEAYVAFNSGTGLTTSPFGLICPPASLAALAAFSSETLELTQASPWGEGLVETVEMSVATFDGSGLTTSPFGFVPMHKPVFTGVHDGGSVPPIFGAWSPISVSSVDAVTMSGQLGTSLGTSAVGNRLGEGGWMDASGSQPASALTTSGGLDIDPPAGGTGGSGVGSIQWLYYPPTFGGLATF